MDVYTTGEMSHRISEEDLKSIKIPIPSPDVQKAIVDNILRKKERADQLRKQAKELDNQAKRELFAELKLVEIPEKTQRERVVYKRT